MGPLDKAFHCYNNRYTERTKYFWQTGGYIYVFVIYGMHFCLNITANNPDKPDIILIIAVEPLSGIDKIKELRGETNNKIENKEKKISNTKKLVNLCNGYGKVGASLNINKSHNSLELCESEDLFLIEGDDDKFEIVRSTRININYVEKYIFKPWRFYIKNNNFVSKVKIDHKYIE